MKFFLFNEITPNNSSKIEFSNKLEDTLKQYKILKNDFSDSIDGIITSSTLENILLLKDFTLADCLKGIENIETRGYGYSVLSKYPIEKHINTDEILIIGTEHYFLLDTIEKDAFYLKVIFDAKGVSFTLNLHNDLSKDGLTIYSKDKSNNYLVDNLFGLESNTKHIGNLIAEEERSKLGNFERLITILDEPIYSKKLELAFNKESKDVQDAIITAFTKVVENIKGEIISPETLLKDVTPTKETKFNIKELKTRDPRAKRLYFSFKDGKYYLASLEDKPLKDRKTNEQNAHIKNAYSKLREWLY